MKTPKRLLSSLLALTMSLYVIPTVWAEDFTQQIQDTPENSYSETLITDALQTEDEINNENTEIDSPQDNEDIVGDDENGGIGLFSLLPMTTVREDILIDRSSGVPAGLEDKPKFSFLVSEVVSGLSGYNSAYSGSIVYSFNDDEYTSVGLNDVITPINVYSQNHEEYGYVDYAYIYFILDGDQLNPSNTRYRVTVYFKYFDVGFIKNTKINVFDQNGTTVPCFNEYSSSSKNEYGTYFNSYCYVSNQNFGTNEYPRFNITLPEGYSTDNVDIYDGFIYDESGLGSSPNIASQIITGIATEPYEMDHYNYPDNYVGNISCYKNLTIVIKSDDGSKLFLPVSYTVYISKNRVSLSPKYNSYDNSESLFSSPNGMYLGTGYFNMANDFNDVTAQIYAYYYDYIDENSDGYGYGNTNKIEYACFGRYASKEAATQNGAADIKNDLFNSSSYATVDFSKFQYVTAYLSDRTAVQVKAVEVTVIDTYGIVHNETIYFGITEEPIQPSGPSIDTYFNVSGAKNAANGTSFRAYRVSGEDDSYFQNGYQTLFILNNNNTLVTANPIYPTFTTRNGAAKIYIGNDVAHETSSTPLQTSGESPIPFESGRAIQYSAASESGTHLKNYWVTFVTQYTEGAKLFVNATNNPDHFSKNGKPQREILINSTNSYHDIFFANIGNATLTGITVSLSDDTQGVKLDDYWTVIDGNTNTLAAFTKTTNPDNIAKVRLVPTDEDYFGGISGTLTISSSNGGSVDIDLTGIAGTPRIVTDELYDGVKYVPYSCVIMTNNMYGNNNMKFSISGGSLPDGMVLRPNGELYGIPMKSGEFTFTVKAEYSGAGQKSSCTQTYTLVIKDNTDANVDATNDDFQGYTLEERVSRYITVYYSGTNNGNPIVDRIVIDSDLFWSEGAFVELQDFYIDGIKLTEGSDYIAEEGSTKITVRAQTFGHIGVTGSDVPHTLAAEFRTDNDDLMRSAQNVYLDYVSTGSENDQDENNSDENNQNGNDLNGNNQNGNDSDGNNQGGNSQGSSGSLGGNSGSSNVGGNSTNTSNSNKDNGSVNVAMRIVNSNGDIISGLAIELHSTPKYASTDKNGSVKFDSVEFGRHTLYIKGASNNKKISKTFSISSGQSIGMTGNVITASAGDTVYITMEYDGSKIKILSVAEDVSSGAGVYSDGKVILMDISKSIFSKETVYITILLSTAIIAFVLRKKIKS